VGELRPLHEEPLRVGPHGRAEVADAERNGAHRLYGCGACGVVQRFGGLCSFISAIRKPTRTTPSGQFEPDWSCAFDLKLGADDAVVQPLDQRGGRLGDQGSKLVGRDLGDRLGHASLPRCNGVTNHERDALHRHLVTGP
jgi:hypothetical protein